MVQRERQAQSAQEERLAEFRRRLLAAPVVDAFDKAYEQLSDILNRVEDDLTDILFSPDAWQTDGRMYPPQSDNLRDVPGRPRVKRFRSRKHSIYIGDNGAIEIRTEPDGELLLSKPGADDLEVNSL
jgi:hypothetical protein